MGTRNGGGMRYKHAVERFQPDLGWMLKIAVLLALACALAPRSLAFHRHLTPEQVRSAYFVGRDQSHRDAFFADYASALQMPKSGPYVQSIEFRTPYEQVALRAQDMGLDYFPPDAEQSYLVNPVHEAVVCARIFETYSFSFPAAAEDSPDLLARLFKFRVSQDGHDLQPEAVTAAPDDSLMGGSGMPSFAGVDVHLHFDLSQLNSSDPVTVTITAPTGQTYSTVFDIAQLR